MSDERLVVHVVEDDGAVRESLRILLEVAGHAVATYATGSEFLAGVEDAEGGCVVVDLHLPDLSGSEVQAETGAIRPDLPFVVITGDGQLATAVAALHAGAVACLEKPFEPPALLNSVHAALAQHRELRQVNAEKANADMLLARLSARERDVIDCLAAGMSAKTIGKKLGISHRTVEAHRAHIMEKFGVKSLAALIRTALTLGFPTSSTA